LITLELPGLTRVGIAIRAWLVAYHRRGKTAKTARDRRRERVDIVAQLGRPTVLDDFLDAKNATSFVWHVATFFTADEIARVVAEHGPKLHAEVLAALAVPRASRPEALGKVIERAGRIVPVMSSGNSRLHHEREALKLELDREDAAVLVTSPFAAAAWIAATK